MVGLVIALLTGPMLAGAAPGPDELMEARAWAAAAIEGIETAPPPGPSIVVEANHDPVQANARNGKPMNMSGRTFTRGLYCHAPSRLLVRLPGPGARFEALAGVDSNEQTSGGRGSVVFRVRAGEALLWRSETLREGMPPVPVSVALDGATEFYLEVGDGDDGISCDQSDWANASVTLEDGRTIALGEVPIASAPRPPYGAGPLFSFDYGGRHSAEFLADWPLTRTRRVLDDARVEHTLSYRDPDAQLEVRCVAVVYEDFPTAEWTIHFKNHGETDTPILSNIQAADLPLFRGDAEFTLHRHRGDVCTADSFEPFSEPLPPGTDRRIANFGGRPTQGEFPYFNLSWSNEGVIFVLSWAGQWAARFTRDDANGLRIRAGQELTHFTLHPGEEVRGPLCLVQFWRGDRLHAQNVWRAWFIAHNLPRPAAHLPRLPQFSACSSHQYGEMIHADSASQLFFIDHYLERGFQLDYWWMDAGWYPNKHGWPQTGTWEVDTRRFPGGLRPITDHAHARGVDSIVWFEPERVARDTWLANERPDWVHGGRAGGLLKLGEPHVREWLTDHVDALLTSEGIDLYRQDFNMDPLEYWRGNDAEDRQGITEIRHVEGYFAYWDALRERHPGLLIDSCASGGRRNDLETLRRAVPLLRSDYIMEPVGNQCHTHALSLWFPFHGTGSSKTDPYLIRSTLGPNYIACWDQRDESIDWPRIREIMDQWKAFGPYYFGDYYPVTPYTLANDAWIGWQFHRPDLSGGMVHVFRRDQSPYVEAVFPLHGLEPDTAYRVMNVDAPDTAVVQPGAELMAQGLRVTVAERPGTGFFVYEEQP